MNDEELDRLVAAASPTGAGWLVDVDLSGAKDELLEEIMATDVNGTPASASIDHEPEPGRRSGRRVAQVVGVAAGLLVMAGALAVLAWPSTEDAPDVATDVTAPPSDTTELPRFLASWIPGGFELANVTPEVSSTEDGVAPSDQAIPEGADAEALEPWTDPDTHVAFEAYYIATPGPSGLPWITLTTTSAPSPTTGAMDGGETVTVRGHEARLTYAPASGSMLATIGVAWEEAPGVYVTLDAINTDLVAADVLRMAQGVVEVGEEEWAAAAELPNRADDTTVASLIPADALGSVVVSTMGEAAYLAADGQVCAFMADGRGQGPVACADPGNRVNVLNDQIGWPTLLYGLMPEGATNILAKRDGDDVDAVPDGMEAPQSEYVATTDDGRTVYAVNLGLIPDSVAFLDAQGQAVETVPVDIDPDL